MNNTERHEKLKEIFEDMFEDIIKASMITVDESTFTEDHDEKSLFDTSKNVSNKKPTHSLEEYDGLEFESYDDAIEYFKNEGFTIYGHVVYDGLHFGHIGTIYNSWKFECRK